MYGKELLLFFGRILPTNEPELYTLSFRTEFLDILFRNPYA